MPKTEVKMWSGDAKCDICGVDCNSSVFYDGETRMGPWAGMCESCFSRFGVGVGYGSGQKYLMKVLVEGGRAN